MAAPMSTRSDMQDGRIDPTNLDAAAKPRRKRRKRDRLEPAAELVDWAKGARKRADARPYPPGIMLEPAGFDDEDWTASHSDSDLWTLQLADAFGTRSRVVIATFLSQLEALCGHVECLACRMWMELSVRTLVYASGQNLRRISMGKGLLLWLVGVPIPVIIVLWLIFR